MLSIGVTGRDRQLDEESRRIEGLVDLLHERALLEGRDFGLRIEPAAYEFVVYDPNADRWLTLDGEPNSATASLPKGVNFELELDSQVVVLKPIDRTFASDLPRRRRRSSRSRRAARERPFRLTLVREATQAKASVDGDAFGKTRIENSDQREKRT